MKLPSFQNAKVLVVGDILLDRYLSGPISRISPEAPVPIVDVSYENETPGGAANVALNIRALGAQVTLLGVVGKDKAAEVLVKSLDKAGVKAHLLETSQPTILKTRIISNRQQILRLDIEEKYVPCSKTLLSTFKKLLSDINIVVFSDYAKGTLIDSQALIQYANSQNIPVLVDPKAKDFKQYEGATIITPNTKEFEAIVGHCENEDAMILKGAQLLRQHALSALLITRGISGMMLLSSSQPPCILKAIAQNVFDVTGAGDTVIAVVAASLSAGADLETAVRLSNIAAAISVRKPGTATVSIYELRRELQAQNLISCNILNDTDLIDTLLYARANGEKIVMTNGCFDLLHPGHIAYLEEARALGDRLIVAINDDNSVRRLKGADRPIHSLHHRMLMIAGLRSVDWVTSFHEDTPARLIELIKPDVLVKGGDYIESEIVGANYVRSYGGDVKILSFLSGCSTSTIIEKIKKMFILEDV